MERSLARSKAQAGLVCSLSGSRSWRSLLLTCLLSYWPWPWPWPGPRDLLGRPNSHLRRGGRPTLAPLLTTISK